MSGWIEWTGLDPSWKASPECGDNRPGDWTFHLIKQEN